MGFWENKHVFGYHQRRMILSFASGYHLQEVAGKIVYMRDQQR